MPEGDTLHRIARSIGPVLKGGTVAAMSTHDLGEVTDAEGWCVTDVRAVGKHLLVEFDAPWILRTHLGMHGRVRTLQQGRSAPHNAVFAITVAGRAPRTVVCTGAYRTEFIREGSARSHARLGRLGPDLLDESVDLGDVVERAMDPSHAHREIAEVLLDQRIASGIGNVYKSEVLFLEGVDPRASAGSLEAATVRSLFDQAARLLQRNLGTRQRTTVPTRRRPHPDSPRLWVYGRGGRPCLECGSAIRRFVQGDMARSTYYCPSCQS